MSNWMNIMCGVGVTSRSEGQKLFEPARDLLISPGYQPGAQPGCASTPLHNEKYLYINYILIIDLLILLKYRLGAQLCIFL